MDHKVEVATTPRGSGAPQLPLTECHMRATPLFLFSLLLLSCTKDEGKNLRYAKKLYYLGHDYFSKHMNTLGRIASLRRENAKLEKELKTLKLTSGQRASIASIRSSKKRIQKNGETIRTQMVLARRFLNAALTELNKAIIANPLHLQAHFELGLIYLKKASVILDMAKRAQCMAGPDLKEREEEANALLAKARKHFLRSTKSKKLRSKAHNNIAAIQLHFYKLDAAIAHGKRALSDLVYQDSFVANSNIGWAYFKKGQHQRAVSAFKQSLLLQPKYCLSRYRLGRAYFELGKYGKANTALERTLKQGPPCNAVQEAWLYLGLTLLKRGREEAAEHALLRCLRIAPSSCVGLRCKRHLEQLTGHPRERSPHEGPTS